MAKKSSTIHIEQCFWDLIESYQNENKMSSRNTAIECILSEYKALKGISVRPSEIIKDKGKKDEEKDLMTQRLEQMEDDMQE